MDVNKLDAIVNRVVNDLHKQLRGKGSSLRQAGKAVFADEKSSRWGKHAFYAWALIDDKKERWVSASKSYPGTLTIAEYNYILKKIYKMSES